MRDIEYTSPPNGNTVIGPRLDRLRGLVLRSGTKYWNSGMGQGALTWLRGPGRPQLLLTFAEPLGFCLEYIDTDECFHVSLGEDREPRTVTVYVGGNPVVLPSRFFVSRQEAWEAVEHFARTGDRAPGVRWGKRADQGWDDDDASAAEPPNPTDLPWPFPE